MASFWQRLLAWFGNKPSTPPPTTTALRPIGIFTEPNAIVELDSVGVGNTNADGYYCWPEVPASLGASHVWVNAKGYKAYDSHIDLETQQVGQDIFVGKTRWDGPHPYDIYLPPLTPIVPPIPTYTEEQMRLIRCNFCNLTDSTNRPIFSSCLAAQTPEMQDEWIAREKAAGGTHYTFSIESGYHTMYGEIINFYDAGRMAEWLSTLDRVLRSGLIPVVMLTAGNEYPGEQYIKDLVKSIPSTYYDKCIWVCGWECVKGSWSSAEYHRGNLALREALGPTPIMGCHLSPTRPSFSSHPLEADDPWKGDEMACWRDQWGPNGHPFKVFMFQSEVVSEGEPFDTSAPESWGERAKEVADRFLGLPGAPDWFAGLQRPTLVWFEATAYEFIRGKSDSEWARKVARDAQSLGYQGFGNGLP